MRIKSVHLCDFYITALYLHRRSCRDFVRSTVKKWQRPRRHEYIFISCQGSNFSDRTKPIGFAENTARNISTIIKFTDRRVFIMNTYSISILRERTINYG